MSDWGMFLHDLDPGHHHILEIDAVNPEKCRAAMSRDGKVPKSLPTTLPPSSTPSGFYSLRDSPVRLSTSPGYPQLTTDIPVGKPVGMETHGSESPIVVL